jgi:hypothetical protein
MKKILIVDNTFPRPIPGKISHTMPTKFEWLFSDSTTSYSAEDLEIVIYTDDRIPNAIKIGKVNIALLLEPEEFIPQIYQWVKTNFKHFDYILTWDKKMLDIDKRFIFYPLGNSWIFEHQFAMYPKNKLVSIVASWKNFLLGHRLRHQIISAYMKPYNLHWYGKRGFDKSENIMTTFDPALQNPIDDLVDAYKDYMFTIIVENEFTDYMFTEKIISPMLAGTVPIYWGCPSIGKFFDIRGIIVFNSVEQLDDILKSLTPEKYNEMLTFARANYFIAYKYKSLPDSIFDVLASIGLPCL